MVYVLHLSKHRVARVWWDELPNARFQPCNSIRESFAAAAPSTERSRTAAIETFVPHGPSYSYGLLGGTLVPDNANLTTRNLSLDVGLSSGPRGTYKHSLLTTLEGAVWIGLDSQYEPGLRAGIQKYRDATTPLSPGRLLIDCAAYSGIGSNQATFTWLIEKLLRIMCGEVPVQNDSELRTLLE